MTTYRLPAHTRDALQRASSAFRPRKAITPTTVSAPIQEPPPVEPTEPSMDALKCAYAELEALKKRAHRLDRLEKVTIRVIDKTADWNTAVFTAGDGTKTTSLANLRRITVKTTVVLMKNTCLVRDT
jgi:hypothetical protein